MTAFGPGTCVARCRLLRRPRPAPCDDATNLNEPPPGWSLLTRAPALTSTRRGLTRQQSTLSANDSETLAGDSPRQFKTRVNPNAPWVQWALQDHFNHIN